MYWVKKCDFTNTEGWVNEIGNPKLTNVEMELWLDETNILYEGEEVFRKIASLTGMVTNAYDVIESQRIGQRPY